MLERLCKEAVIAHFLFTVAEICLDGQGKTTATWFGVAGVSVVVHCGVSHRKLYERGFLGELLRCHEV
jgi:hypothetical protein